jgi:hypothetical protein
VAAAETAGLAKPVQSADMSSAHSVFNAAATWFAAAFLAIGPPRSAPGSVFLHFSYLQSPLHVSA